MSMVAREADELSFGQSWRAFLRRAALGSGPLASDARLVETLGGDCPGRSRERVRAGVATGKYDDEAASLFYCSISVLEKARAARGIGYKIVPKPDDWMKVKGGHMRKTHTEEKVDHEDDV